MPNSVAATISPRSAFPNLFALLRVIPRPRWALPSLVLLGIFSSLAEMIGIMLIPLFFYSMMNELGSLASSGGLLGSALHFAIKRFHSSQEITLVFLMLIIVRGLLAYAYATMTSHVSEDISQMTRERVHHLFLMLPYGYVQRHEQADLIETLGREVYLLGKGYTSLTRILVNSTFIVMLGMFLAVISWKITICVIVGSLLLSTVLHLLSASASAIGTDVKRVHRQLWDNMMVTLQGMRVIRAYGQEHFHQKEFQKSSANARHIIVRELQLLLLLDPLTEVGYLIILGFIIFSAQSFGINFATTLTCVALLYRLQPHVRELEGHRLTLLQLEPQLASVRAILEEEQHHQEPARNVPVNEIRQGICFEDVTFSYDPDTPPVLEHATFDIPAGKITALVGVSGSGKTTVVNLLLGLYKPTSGVISVDGISIQNLSRIHWLKTLAVAGQDIDLIEGSVIDNIKMADPDASQSSVSSATEAMGVSEFLSSLPHGDDTWVGQQSIRFSGGQRQCIGLARAALHKPKFLILDEAMNAMDIALEERIWGAIHTRFQGCTILIITHRLGAVRTADHVVRIEGGRITSEGPQHNNSQGM